MLVQLLRPILSEELRCRRARTETRESTARGYGPSRAGGKGEVQQEGAQVQKKGSHLQGKGEVQQEGAQVQKKGNHLQRNCSKVQ